LSQLDTDQLQGKVALLAEFKDSIEAMVHIKCMIFQRKYVLRKLH